MNLIIIGLIAFAIYCATNRDRKPEETLRQHARTRRDTEQMERLKARVAVLEEILLDRDRQLRDGFRGL